MYSKYELFYLPFDLQQKDDIIYIFNEMVEVAESRKQKNKTMRAFLESFGAFSIEKFTELLEEYQT
jgi:hypothetical protein